ncbi:MAG: hypothetical protein IM473_14730 [Microcystis sp. M015S2]|jgi:hypothetical protein|uniref:hypothetical protein n=1 Tax=unclassified Microcystis TaxID=2643300 RepID=UPI00258EEE8B|nr:MULTISPECIES: hypothetical protein [unclassified Microcystis]MCA2710722.1 hypothetical protein [Microcystis sp. M025S2]MCA2743616.1 hypothetical protein [Microcystis sp. M015S2]NCR23282.1 hypothetical protein [Microcystis aeruginosa L111-01]
MTEEKFNSEGLYNDVPQILLEYATKLSLTPESYRQKTEGAILLEEAARVDIPHAVNGRGFF